MSYYVDAIMDARSISEIMGIMDEVEDIDTNALSTYKWSVDLQQDKEYVVQYMTMVDALRIITDIETRGYAINHDCEDFLIAYGIAMAIRYGTPYDDVIVYLNNRHAPVDSDMWEVFQQLAAIHDENETLYYHILKPILRGHVDLLLPKADAIIHELRQLIRIHAMFNVLE